MYISLEAFVYTMTTICTFALGIGLGGYIENRRIKSFNIEALIRNYMVLASHISDTQKVPTEIYMGETTKTPSPDITQELYGEEDDYI